MPERTREEKIHMKRCGREEVNAREDRCVKRDDEKESKAGRTSAWTQCNKYEAARVNDVFSTRRELKWSMK